MPYSRSRSRSRRDSIIYTFYILVAISALIMVVTVLAFFPPDPISQIQCEREPPPSLEASCSPHALDRIGGGDWEFDTGRDAQNYGMSRTQCRKAFPKLFVELEKVVEARGGKKIGFEELEEREWREGMVRGLVHRGQLSILNASSMTHTFTRAKATLSSLHRALLTTSSPLDPHNNNNNTNPLPDIEFILSTDDFTHGPQPIWTYSTRDGDDWAWLMPDFGYWAWPEVGIGSYTSVRTRMAEIEQHQQYHQGGKIQKLLWRGNLQTAPDLRGKLLDATRGKSWADVKALDWGNAEDMKENFLPIEDHCRYMFLAHVEGRSFSGRGKYLQNCRSVFITHPLVWREMHHAALVSSGSEQNYIELAGGGGTFKDLDDVMGTLLDRPELVERIAENGVRTFRERYLTPAAEACYWRELVGAYGDMLDFKPEVYTNESHVERRGVTFESWILDGRVE
ncbi:hypothetical protein AJ80_05834 [Polytolypa hystricis UAMH7299]|uniref:Glycosyl transferase CAP10 domain-containing protein n=1 Tax=Polytolypa hystricis (strain UAMH7299) TaxID=1447883 RepID=A0A2B7Y0U1_POLH7|nr:hypothetical protein AJ80_05834 [Polytolypa hystricis UAMH7299]